MAVRLALLVLVAACGARPSYVKPVPQPDEIALYRDAALVRQRVEVDLAATTQTVTVLVAAGVPVQDVVLVDAGDLTITGVHGLAYSDPETTADDTPASDESGTAELDEDVDDPLGAQEEVPSESASDAASDPPRVAAVSDAGRGSPTVLRVDVTAPRPGRYAFVVGYATKRIRWSVAYTVIATPERDAGSLRGALEIDNTTGVVLRAAHARLFDAELGPWRGKTAEQLASALVGGAGTATGAAQPRELGAVELADGETRVELVPASTRAMRSVLVYDPIGTKLDNPGPQPLREARLGVDVETSARVSESFELARDRAASQGLPEGPVRLLERRADGSLAVLGGGRLFDAKDADVDTISIGTAEGVTGARERRELTIDDESRRLVEEFVITLDNRRARPASVLVREHLYRGQNWTLAYHSAAAAAKEGAQQIALRGEVPARSHLKILYVVVYTWGP